MDYILLGWQTSTYKLKKSDKKWFMKPYIQIIEDTGIPRSSLERYIKELDEEGYIERRQALYSRTRENGEFEVKKGTYIHITDKLLTLLSQYSPAPAITSSLNKNDIHNVQNNKNNPDRAELLEKSSDCTIVENNEGIDSLILRESYIRDHYSSLLNNIISLKITTPVDKHTLQRLTRQFEAVKILLFTDIKEEIPDEIKKLVLGTFFNLTFKHHKHFSSPKQIAAEYMFALLNVNFYMNQVACFKHRNNILAKIIRTNNWHTPKGFYNHFYLGQPFRDKQELREARWQQQKEREIRPALDDAQFSHNDERLSKIETQIMEKVALIEELTKTIYQQSCAEDIKHIQDKVSVQRKELEVLWNQQLAIEQEIERHGCESIKYCA